MLKLFILPVSVLFYTFFKKGGKSHMASYLVTIATDFRQKGTCEKKYKQTKKKRNQNRPSFKAPHSLRSSESLASY